VAGFLIIFAFLSTLAAATTAPPEDARRGTSRVTHIEFDHANGTAIPLRVNRTTSIPKPEWVDGSHSGAALYVQNSPVTLRARFEAPMNVQRAFIGTAWNGPLGKVKGQWVYFTNGVSDPEYYTFETVGHAPAGLGVHEWDWQWLAATPTPFGMALRWLNVSGAHTIYTVLDTPGLPWKTDVSSDQNPWTDALDLILQHTDATDVETVLDDVTAFCFDLPSFKYDTWSGAPCYINGNWRFNVTLYISDVNGGANPRVGCCYDGGAIVHTFADLLGAQTHFVLSGSPYTSQYFGYLNCIDPIGRGEDYSNNPFLENSYYRDDPITYQDGSSSSCKRSRLGNHAFAATEVGASGTIWDGTMCADVDSNQDTSVKYPPDGNAVSTNLSATVLTDSSANWVADEWIGMLLNPNTKTTSPNPYVEYVIMGNTATQIFVALGMDMTQYADPGDHYWVRDPNDPEVDIVRLTGYDWPDYEAISIDFTTTVGGRADPPVERKITLY